MKTFRFTMAALATAAIAATASTAPAAFAQMRTAQTETMPAETMETPIEVESDAAVEAQVNASQFGATAANQSAFVLSTNPTSRLGGQQRYGLMIIEQKKADPLCFSTTGSNPTQVLPLLAQLPDFSGICGRSTDTNGYLIRAAGDDISYDPVLEEKDGVLVLFGIPRRSAGQNARPIIIGQTDGISPTGYTKIFLNPGWRIDRQTFNNKETGRLYVANDLTLAQLVEQSGGEIIAQPPTGTTPPVTTPPVVTPPTPVASFPDVSGDIYANEINRAVQLGVISGFREDNTFRPRASLTREQVVSIVLDGLREAPADSTVVSTKPYPDVPTNRWSAAKIQKAAALGFISGYPDGTFRPTQEVTRAELMAIMRKASQFRTEFANLPSNQPGRNFTDTQGHWAQGTISTMSEFCGLATPMNETGSAFMPNQAAKRNYAAAAMVRLLDCPQLARQ
ncbi:MAG: DUF3747 domain-containing protein [Phormidesmis sp.]